ncbi:MAG: hypothetical protein GY696_31090 [Gammaproteobacteria bacterium]|nr:hypothetical protein [Gammaproteobacteria bacterium]
MPRPITTLRGQRTRPRQGGAWQAGTVDHRDWPARERWLSTAPHSVGGWRGAPVETGHVTYPQQYQDQGKDGAFQQRYGGGAPPSTGQPKAHAGPGPIFQPGYRVWYLAIQPAKLDRIQMVRTWTWPWVVAFKVAPDLYQIRAYSQAKVQTIRTAHVGQLRRSPPGIQEGSVESRPESEEELPEEPWREELLPEEPLPEEPLPEEPLPEEPLPEELLPEELLPVEPLLDKPLPEEESVQATDKYSSSFRRVSF